jgi:uncharacterized protein YqgV (UPF0045/DUF77 family)
MHAYEHIVPKVDEIHKRHARIKLDIYFFITITGSISLATGGLLVPKVIIAPMIPLGTNSPPVASVIDPVIETLTTGPMTPSGTNSPPADRVIDSVIETLTTGAMISSGSNSQPVARVIDLIDRMHAYEHIVPKVDEIHKRHVRTKLDIYFFITITGSISLATGGLLVPEVIIAPVVEYCFHYYVLQCP